MRRRKLLIADDSEMNRAILANVLDQEFEVIEATNGQEVIIALQSYGKQISALLLDIVMPEMDGFEKTCCPYRQLHSKEYCQIR